MQRRFVPRITGSRPRVIPFLGFFDSSSGGLLFDGSVHLRPSRFLRARRLPEMYWHNRRIAVAASCVFQGEKYEIVHRMLVP